MQILGLRTTIYPAPDLAASKAWFTKLLGTEPYFDQPFYVGYNIGGYELGLNPDADPDAGVQSYWGVPEIKPAFEELIAAGCEPVLEPTHTGEGIWVARARNPLGDIIGLIENPVFELPADAPASGGPGR